MSGRNPFFAINNTYACQHNSGT